MKVTNSQDRTEINFSSKVPAEMEALRALLKHENIAFNNGVGVNGDTLSIKEADLSKSVVAIKQWQHAVSNIVMAIQNRGW